MFSWAKNAAQGAMSAVAGTAEPIYGPEAIGTVKERSEGVDYTELTSKDLVWLGAGGTTVETQQFYVTTESGYFGMAQVLYSVVQNIRTTCHFNIKLWHATKTETNVWSSTPIHNHAFDEAKTSFYADNVAVVLSEDGGSYKVKSMADQNALCNLVFTRLSPGFMAGKDGRSTYGTDQTNPWGEIRHLFWPRCQVEGHFVIGGETVHLGGTGLFIHALQNMKPHHAAARWNFANFQGPTISAALMEFTTPESYGNTRVAVGGIAKDGEVITASADCTAEHIKTVEDAEVGWLEPREVKFTWNGKSKTGDPVVATIEKDWEQRMDRVDVMHEVPGFVKQIVAVAAGTKPYIYQFFKPATLKIKVGDTETTEDGVIFSEATFIC